jgi:hypothetical protein
MFGRERVAVMRAPYLPVQGIVTVLVHLPDHVRYFPFLCLVPQRHEHLIQVVLVDDPVLLLVEKSKARLRSSASFFLAKRSRAWLYLTARDVHDRCVTRLPAAVLAGAR